MVVDGSENILFQYEIVFGLQKKLQIWKYMNIL